MKKSAYLLAYSHKNFGDDLFIQLLCKRYPDTVFYLKSSITNKAFAQIENLNLLQENIFQKILKKIFSSYIPFSSLIRKQTSVILIGGSMFMQSEKWERKLAMQQRVRNLSKRFCLLGSNFGPYQDDLYLTSYKKFFDTLDDCCFRDRYSHHLFSGKETNRYAFDIAFSVSREKVVEKSNCVLVSVIDVSRRKELVAYEKQYLDAITMRVRRFCEEGKKVILLSFCEKQGDLDVCKKIKNDFLSDENVNIVNYDGDTEQIIDLFAKSDFVIASRFHAMIMGFRFGCKVFPIVYNEKLSNVLSDVNVSPESYSLKNVKNIDLSQSVEIKDISELKSSAQQQFAYLDKLLK